MPSHTQTAVTPAYRRARALSGASRHRLLACLLLMAAGGCGTSSRFHDSPQPSAAGDGAVDTASVAGAFAVADEAQVDHADATAAIAAAVGIGFRSVWGATASDVWIVGMQGIVLHFDGETFERIESGVMTDLAGVHGSSHDDVWVVGSQGSTLHWDGVRLAERGNDPTSVLLGIWASSARDVWAVGLVPVDRAGLLRHWDGEHWEEAEVPGCSSLWRVWGTAPDDIWLAGNGAPGQGLVMRGDGMKFSPMPYRGNQLRGLWGSARDDVWVVPYDAAPQHWDGEAWRNSEAFSGNSMLSAWGSARDDIWSVGLGGSIQHYDGTSWTMSESGTKENLWGIWGSAPNDVWAVGGNSTVLRWNGSEWRELAPLRRRPME